MFWYNSTSFWVNVCLACVCLLGLVLPPGEYVVSYFSIVHILLPHPAQNLTLLSFHCRTCKQRLRPISMCLSHSMPQDIRWYGAERAERVTSQPVSRSDWNRWIRDGCSSGPSLLASGRQNCTITVAWQDAEKYSPLNGGRELVCSCYICQTGTSSSCSQAIFGLGVIL